MSLAVCYRPSRFDTVLAQGSVIKILEKQLETKTYTNCYLFAGPSGTGKTTLARIFANEINNHKGQPIEIDAASNNGVEAVRAIIDDANQRAIDSEYKIFVIDECHMITQAGWNAFLKCIEEPPKYTIFMFCTTDPQKIPATITNRLMRFNLSKVPTNLIKTRLNQICESEQYTNYEEACDYISKLSEGCVRQAIAYVEQCANFSNDLDINNVLECLGNFSYDSFFDLTGALLNGDEATVLETVNKYYAAGNDLKLFIESYLDFALDITKYSIFKIMDVVKIPVSLENRCQGFASIPNITDWSNKLVEAILNIKNTIKYDVNAKTTIEAMMIKICRGL